MKQTNVAGSGVQVTEIIGGLKVITYEVEVKVPVFKDYEVKQPVFIAEEVKLPVGWDKLSNAMASDIYEKVMAKLLAGVDGQLEKAIKDRIDTIRVPKIVEELNVIVKDVSVQRPIFTDVKVDRPVFVDKTILNPILKDIEVLNALIIDKPVTNAIVQDVNVKNAVIHDVVVERAIIRDKYVDA